MRLLNNRYKIIRKIDEGSAGVVYLAEDTAVSQDIILKVINFDLAETPNLDFFIQEYRTLNSLSHPGIVRVYDFSSIWSVDGHAVPPQYYLFTMEYIKGAEFATGVSEINDEQKLYAILGEMIGTINYIHFNGFLHNDIRSKNIFITRDGETKFLDFGISQRLKGPEPLDLFKKAGEYKDLFRLAEKHMAERSSLVKLFLLKVRAEIDFQNGFNLIRIFDIYNFFSPENPIMPAHTAIDSHYTVANLGLNKRFSEIKAVLEKKQPKNKVLFVTGDSYSESIPFFYEILSYERFREKKVIRLATNTLADTISDIFLSLKEFDQDEKFIDDNIPEVNSAMRSDESALMGERKYITFNRALSVIRAVSEIFELTFVVTYISSKREEISDFFLYLMNSLSNNGITWFFFDIDFPVSFRRGINEENNDVSQFAYEFLDRVQFAKTVQSILLIPEDVSESYSALNDVLYAKTSGKCVLLSTLLSYLIKEKMIQYKNGSYEYDLDAIKAYPFSFTYSDIWMKNIKDLDENDILILSVTAYYEKYIPTADLADICREVPGFENRLQRLLANKTLTSHGDKEAMVTIRGQLFSRFVLDSFTLPDKYASRVIVRLMGESSRESLESSYFIISKLKRFASSHPYVCAARSMELLTVFSRETHRSEVLNTADFLEELTESLPAGRFHSQCIKVLALFYYYDNQDERALTLLASIDPGSLHGDDILDYYLSYAKALFFSGDPSGAEKMCIKGNLLAKQCGSDRFRYYFLNVKALVLAGDHKTEHALNIYRCVYGHVKKNGIAPELSNFIVNYFNLLVATENTDTVLACTKDLLSVLDTRTYMRTKSVIQILTESAYALISSDRIKQSFSALNKAFALAEKIQSHEDMIRILNLRVTAKYFLYFDIAETISDLNMIIDIAKKNRTLHAAGGALQNLIESYMEIGDMKKAFDSFRVLARYVIAPSHGKNLQEVFPFFHYGSLLNIKAGNTRLSFRFLTMYARKLRSVDEGQRMFHRLNYLAAKAQYYKYLRRDDKATACLEQLIEYNAQNRAAGFSALPYQDIRRILLDLALSYESAGDVRRRDDIMKTVNADYGSETDPNGEINWAFYRAITAVAEGEKRRYLDKALRFCIKRKDFVNIDIVVEKYLDLLKKRDFKFFNAVYLLYISLRKFYDNLPEDYRKKWLSLPYISRMTDVLKTHLGLSGAQLVSDEADVPKKISGLFSADLMANNIKMIQKLNNEIWDAPSEKLIPVILKFMKKYFMAQRIVLRSRPEQNSGEEINIKYYSKDLYAQRDRIDETLVQRSFRDGDFVTADSKDFGEPLSTMVIPILNPLKKRPSCDTDKRVKNITYSDLYLGYIYIDTKFPLSNINESALSISRICVELIGSTMVHDQINRNMMQDQTTGIMNRHFFLNELKRKMSLRNKEQTNLVFLMVDIDHFKKVNDRYGHQKGDIVLNKIAALLKKGIRKNDLIGRYGGEEFIIVLFDISEEEGRKRALALKTSIEKASMLPGLHLTISIGCSQYPKDSEWINILINQADTALLSAKNHGRNKVMFWNTDLSDERLAKDPLHGIINEDFSRSENIIRNLLGFIDYEQKSTLDAFKEMMRCISTAIPHKHAYYEIYINGKKYSKNENGYIHSDADIRASSGKVIINWGYMKKNNGPLHHDLIYGFSVKGVEGFIIYSSPVSETEYNDGHYNLIEKYFKLFFCKI